MCSYNANWPKNTNSERSDSIHTAALKQGNSQQQRSQLEITQDWLVYHNWTTVVSKFVKLDIRDIDLS
jgi:HKD family nuclease